MTFYIILHFYKGINDNLITKRKYLIISYYIVTIDNINKDYYYTINYILLELGELC